MDQATCERGERTSEGGARFHTVQVRATNTGKCVEDPVRDGEVCLHLGSGNVYWTAWINVDGSSQRADVKCDVRKLDFPDNYASRIAAIHLFEHFYYWDVPDVLKEWHRVLKPGGQIILELPCMDKVFSHIAACVTKGIPMKAAFTVLPLWGDPRYKDPAMCHRWGYSKFDMLNLLTDAGFVNVKDEEPHYHFPVRDMRITAMKGA